MAAIKDESLTKIAARLRGAVVEMSHRAGTPHLGSSLSCIDILTALYWDVMQIDPTDAAAADRDRFILSKGHAATALYNTLEARGFFPASVLASYNVDGGALAEHPGPHCAPGVEAATGSLGHGLPIGLGHALAARIQGREYRVFVLLSDGECNEGSVWEAAMFAAAQKLDRVCAIIDYNKWQATGRSDETLALAPLKEKWAAFGWDAHEVDGHDLDALTDLLRRVPNGSGKPVAIVAHTVKGRGISFMEDDNNWHYRIPKAEEVMAAKRELGLVP
ncbi:MAG: transketolase [Stellaceae bacterium]